MVSLYACTSHLRRFAAVQFVSLALQFTCRQYRVKTVRSHLIYNSLIASVKSSL